MRDESVFQMLRFSIFDEFKGLKTILNQVYLIQDGELCSVLFCIVLKVLFCSVLKDLNFFLGKFFSVGHFLA